MLIFRATLNLEGKTATGIQVPADIVAALGPTKRPPVLVTINGYTYRSTVAPYNGVYMLPVAAEHREKAGIQAGEEVEVGLVLDNAPREVEVPPDFAEALERDAQAKQAFDKLSYSNKRRFVLPIEEAKSDETRARRIEKAVSNLREGKI
jgi:hypothetical protein